MNRPLRPATPSESNRRPLVAGFTLVEIMVSMTLFLILMGVTASVVSSTQMMWSRTSSQTSQMRNARHAFEIVSHRIGQATLNSYWTVTYDGNVPKRYERASELRFHSGPASELVPSAAPGGSAIFFQSPTGYYSDGSGELGCALNTWGYFVEYGSDRDYRPPFLNDTTTTPERYRYRLVEFLDPSNALTLFSYTSGSQTYTGDDWFAQPLNTPGRKRVLADNIIAFVVMPRLSSLESASLSALAPDLKYDSTIRLPDALLNPRNQLPPMVEIAALVIDEQSAAKIQWNATPPDFGVQRGKLFLSADTVDIDLATLRNALHSKGITAEIFRITVPIASSRWSTEQAN